MQPPTEPDRAASELDQTPAPGSEPAPAPEPR
jgi:hypothetical protein